MSVHKAFSLPVPWRTETEIIMPIAHGLCSFSYNSVSSSGSEASHTPAIISRSGNEIVTKTYEASLSPHTHTFLRQLCGFSLLGPAIKSFLSQGLWNPSKTSHTAHRQSESSENYIYIKVTVLTYSDRSHNTGHPYRKAQPHTLSFLVQKDVLCLTEWCPVLVQLSQQITKPGLLASLERKFISPW